MSRDRLARISFSRALEMYGVPMEAGLLADTPEAPLEASLLADIAHYKIYEAKLSTLLKRILTD